MEQIHLLSSSGTTTTQLKRGKNPFITHKLQVRLHYKIKNNLFIYYYAIPPMWVGAVNVNAKKDKRVQRRKRKGLWHRRWNLLPQLIGDDEQQQKNRRKETVSGNPTQLPWNNWSPIMTHSDHTVSLLFKPTPAHRGLKKQYKHNYINKFNTCIA